MLNNRTSKAISDTFRTVPATVDLKILDVGKDWIKVQWNLLSQQAPISHHILRVEFSNENQEPNGKRNDTRVENLQFGEEYDKIQRNIRNLESGEVYFLSVLTYYNHGTYIQTPVIPVSTKTSPPGRLTFSDNTDSSFRVHWEHPAKNGNKSNVPRGYHIRWKQYGTKFEELMWEDSMMFNKLQEVLIFDQALLPKI